MDNRGNKRIGSKSDKRRSSRHVIPQGVPLDQFFPSISSNDEDIAYLWVIFCETHHRKHKLAIPNTVSAVRDYVRSRTNHSLVGVCGRDTSLWHREEAIIRLKKGVYHRRVVQGQLTIPVVFYTGHGDVEGNWSFSDSTADLMFLLNPEYGQLYDLGRPLIILADCCYAGNWCISDEAADWGYGSTIIAAAEPGDKVFERTSSPGDESNFMKVLLGRDRDGRPECKVCKALRTKKVQSHKDYTKHKCGHVRNPFVFRNGTLSVWDCERREFRFFGEHKCRGWASRLPLPPPPENEDDDDNGRESQLDQVDHDSGTINSDENENCLPLPPQNEDNNDKESEVDQSSGTRSSDDNDKESEVDQSSGTVSSDENEK